MPGLKEEYSIIVFSSASSLDQSVWDAFDASPRAANIISAHASERLSKEQAGESSPPGQFWLVCKGQQSSVEFVLSCTLNTMGASPIFLFCPHPRGQTSQFLFTRLERLIDELEKVVPQARVFSVFGPDVPCDIFVGIWCQRTHISHYEQPYYAAKLTYVTKKSLINRSTSVHPDFNYELRLGVEADIPKIAPLCYGFAKKAVRFYCVSYIPPYSIPLQEPFTLSHADAEKEAKQLVHSGKIWVHLVNLHGAAPEIASIVVVGRDSGSVAAITKVFTNPRWRRHGCAERLVRRVCKS